MESELSVNLGYHMACSSGRKHETVVEIEESGGATAQSKPAERPGNWQKPLPSKTIPKVPEGHYYGGRDAYEPSIISIGPYHRGKPRLLDMESLKSQCFYEVKDREKKDWTLDECFMPLEQEGMEARKCYSENTDLINDKDFLEMMMLDACFIIEYCHSIAEDTLSRLLQGRIWLDTAIRNDLLLLENQIPLSFVREVFSIFELGDDQQLIHFVYSFCRHVSPINTNQLDFIPDIKDTRYWIDFSHSIHLLHFYRSILFHNKVKKPPNTASPCASPDFPFRDWHYSTLMKGKMVISQDLKTRTGSRAQKPIHTIRSATFLEEAGIELQQEVDEVMSVTFKNGILKITPLFVDAFTVSQFRNIIALEKHDSSLEPRGTAFTQFMDYIINTSKDVDLLRKKGILDHSLGSDEDIATIFNKLTSGILEYRTVKLEEMYEAVDTYCKRKRHLWWAMLMKDYFGSPWTAISLVAAVILLSLTFIQTFFSMYTYFRPPSGK